MKYIDEITKIFQKFNFRYTVNITDSLDQIIAGVENKIIHERLFPDNPTIMVSELWQLKRLVDLEKLNENQQFRKVIDEILINPDFSETKEFLVYNKPIDVSIIKMYEDVIFLKKHQQKKIKSYGYGIESFKIVKGWNILDVYCVGKHSNVSSNSNTLCLDDSLLNKKLNIDNIESIQDLLTCMHITDAYLQENEVEQILGVLNET